jgi:hypothetical protein
MTPCMEYLHDYIPLDKPRVIQAAGHHPLYCVGLGTIKFVSVVAGVTHRRELHDVWHVPDMSVSLLSTQALKRMHCRVFSAGNGDLTEYVVDSNNVCFLVCPHPGTDNGLNKPDFAVVMNQQHVSAQHDTGPPPGICTFSSAVHASDPESPELWHQRLGHINYQYMYQLVSKGLIKGVGIHPAALKPVHNHVCEVCVMAKHQRAPASTKDAPAESPMHILHSDVCVYSTPALSGERYAVTLLDEFTNYAGIGLLHTKDQVERTLREAITLWENKTGYTCKTLFTDRGGEYLGGTFTGWLKQKGIAHHMSAPRTPMTNGRAERLNQTLNNIVRAMLLQYNLPKSLWGHALLYAKEIHNRGYNKVLQLTPFQAFLKQVPSVHSFRTFGCKVYARLPETTRDKLDPKSELGIYLGPSQDGPGHKVLTYQPHLKIKNKYKVHIYRDIVTFERLTDVCGVQTSSPGDLRWGGDIPLPASSPALSQPGEPMTGQPDLVQALTPQQLQHLLQYGRTPVTSLPVNGTAAAPPQQACTPLAQPSDMHSHAPASGSGTHHDEHAQTQPVHSMRTRSQAHQRGVAAPQPLQGMAAGSGTPMGVAQQQSQHTASSPQQAMQSNHDASPPAQTGTDIARRVRWVDEVGPVRRTASPPTPSPASTQDSTIVRHYSAMFSVAEFLQECVVDPALGPALAVAMPEDTSAAGPHSKKQKISISSALKQKLIPFEHICLPLKCEAIIPFADALKYPLPKSVKEALSGPFAYEWLKALLEELQSLLENGTWELVPYTPGMKVIPCHWVFTIKCDADGMPVRFKCRLVAGGNHQEHGIDYLETYAPVSRHATLKTFLAIAAMRRWKVHQIDIKTAFLNGPIDTVVYMMQPPGFKEGVRLVCKLLRCLYGLKQAPKQWYDLLAQALKELGFQPQQCDPSFWVSQKHACIVYITSVVDDMMIASADESVTLFVIQQILHRFKGTHGGIAHHYCGMKLDWNPHAGTVKLTQTAYIDKVCESIGAISRIVPRTVPMDPSIKFIAGGTTKLPDSPLLDVTRYPYRTLVGALNYVACCTRPDIAYTVNQLARRNNAPTVVHWMAAVTCLGYLSATRDIGIVLGGNSTPAIAHVDASHGTGTPDLKSVGGHIIQVFGGPVTWSSKTIPLTCTSSTESEYRALSSCVKEVLWMQQVLRCFGVVPRPFPVKSDNMGAIRTSKNNTPTAHTKHIELHVHFLRERVQLSEVDIIHIPGTDNPADLLTKPLPRCMLEDFRQRMGVR